MSLLARMRLLVVVMVAFATLATACGGDDAEPIADPAPDTDSDDSDDSPVDEPEETTSSTSAAPVVLTDSFRGVTAERIKVGVVAPDLAALAGLVDLDHGSYEAAYRAIVDEVNGNGGVLGREIDIVFEDYLPIGAEGMDTVCSRFTDDEEVFAVLGSLQDDGPLCYTQLSDTALVGSTQNDFRVESSTAPWFTGWRNSDNVVETIIRGFAEKGVFDGEVVGVVAAIGDRGVVENVALPLLEELDVNVVDVALQEASPIDTVAAENEVGLIAEKQESNGVTLVLGVGGGTPVYVGGIENLSFRPRIATTSLSSLRAYIRDRDGRDLAVLEGSVAGNTAEQLGWWDDPAIQACIDVVEASGEPTIFDPNTRPPEEPENLVSVAAACRDVALFVAIATAAGPDLTNDTFRAAGEALGEFHVPGYGPAFYSAETPDGRAPIFYYEWDDALQDLRTDGTTL